MEHMNQSLSQLWQMFDVGYALSFILITWGLVKTGQMPKKWKPMWIAVIVATVIGTIFLLLGWIEDAKSAFITYCVGTSCYELLIKHVLSAIGLDYPYNKNP